MIINNSKTKMLCISAAKSYEPQAYLLSDSGDRVQSTEQLRVLGFHFDGSPNVRYHMKLLNRRFECRIWALRHLKRGGFSKQDLVTVYKTMIRPVAEYCSVVFHSMVTNAESLDCLLYTSPSPRD